MQAICIYLFIYLCTINSTSQGYYLFMFEMKVWNIWAKEKSYSLMTQMDVIGAQFDFKETRLLGYGEVKLHRTAEFFTSQNVKIQSPVYLANRNRYKL